MCDREKNISTPAFRQSPAPQGASLGSRSCNLSGLSSLGDEVLTNGVRVTAARSAALFECRFGSTFGAHNLSLLCVNLQRFDETEGGNQRMRV